ncbi:hypothetical protein AAEO56_17535 [Flavobacterium sp. DGU11]|uniref:Phosphoribosylpyrophosphate synthetase n=1 Tax=Flavobacterium arundinis TaxID=3139143 RepID=A0ABU9I0Y5_9FLAO
MTDVQILEKVKRFLKERGTKYNIESLKYLGIKENEKLIDGTLVAMHIVSYDIESDAADGKTFFISLDANTDKFIYLVTPNRIIDIDE